MRTSTKVSCQPYIVPLIALQQWDEPEVKIIMELQLGSLESLITDRSFDKQELQQVAVSVFHHDLQALNHISLSSMIHRDIKPANILFKGLHGQDTFLLGDFGLSNRSGVAHTFMGSLAYVAPEMFENGCQQTHKIDVWAFFVTIMWTLDVGEFRQLVEKVKSLGDLEKIRKEIFSRARKPNLSSIQEMAIEDPAKRASAAQMLVKCFNGEGLSTLRNKIFALIETPSTASNVRKDTQHDGKKVAARKEARAGAFGLAPQTRNGAKTAGIKKIQNKAPGPMARYLTPMSGKFPGEDA
jgi:serine/threonine protein kinase